MPWKGVTVSEERQRFLQDYRLKYYSVSDLAERFSISRRTAHTHPGHQGKWIDRFKEHGQSGFLELSRRPHHYPGQTDAAIVQQLVELRKAHPRWGPDKLLELMGRDRPQAHLPSISTAARILAREGRVQPRRRYRRVHPAISLERTQQHFGRLFQAYGLPHRIRTDNDVPFASSALARLSQLSVRFIQLGIYPELTEPGRSQQPVLAGQARERHPRADAPHAQAGGHHPSR